MSKSEIVLVYLETSGNQQFIFGTNKLKENVGASEMTYRVGTKMVATAVNDVFFGGNATMLFDETNPEVLQNWIENLQTPIESNGTVVEVIIATSGKALLLVRGDENARKFVTAWSLKVTAEAPGVDAVAVFSEPFAMSDTLDAFSDRMSEVHHRFDKARVMRPSPERRFPRLPIVAGCAISGGPASRAVRYEKDAEPELLSEVSWHKRLFAHKAGDRFAWLLGNDNLDAGLVKNLDVLEKKWGCDWIAVIHADGNGLGQLFLNFGKHALACGATGIRDYVRMYREFSHAIDRLTLAAFRETADRIPPKQDPSKIQVYPILPIVVGGDDLTIVCDGTYALDFTVEFLRKLEALLGFMEADSALVRLLTSAFHVPRMGMCAGVAIIKPHFPFFMAYHLAENLIKSAKDVRKKVTNNGDEVPCSALDFHIVYDSAVIDLDSVRRRLEPGDGFKLYAKPFVTTPISSLGALSTLSKQWAEAHSWDSFARAHAAIAAPSLRDTDRRALPNSQAHFVRSLLHSDPAEAERVFERLRRRYRADGFKWGDEELFFADPEDGSRKLTRFQDALESLRFSGGKPPFAGDRS